MAFDGKFQKMTNAVLFIDGNNSYGKVEEINNPKIVAKMVEHKVCGMNGTLDLPSGLDKMEASFKLNGPLEEVASMSANVKLAHTFTFRGNMELYDGQSKVADRPYVVIFKGTFKESPLGEQKQHENTELVYTLSITYVKLTVNGVPRVEIDVINNIHKVDGVDLLAQAKANMGIGGSF